MITGQMILDTANQYEPILDFGMAGIIIFILVRFIEQMQKKQDERDKLLIEIIGKR